MAPRAPYGPEEEPFDPVTEIIEPGNDYSSPAVKTLIENKFYYMEGVTSAYPDPYFAELRQIMKLNYCLGSISASYDQRMRELGTEPERKNPASTSLPAQTISQRLKGICDYIDLSGPYISFPDIGKTPAEREIENKSLLTKLKGPEDELEQARKYLSVPRQEVSLDDPDPKKEARNELYNIRAMEASERYEEFKKLITPKFGAVELHSAEPNVPLLDSIMLTIENNFDYITQNSPEVEADETVAELTELALATMGKIKDLYGEQHFKEMAREAGRTI